MHVHVLSLSLSDNLVMLCGHFLIYFLVTAECEKLFYMLHITIVMCGLFLFCLLNCVKCKWCVYSCFYYTSLYC